MRRAIALIAALVCMAMSAAPALADELLVSAAMSLRPALENIKPMYEAEHPGIKLVMNYSSSGKLRQQIEAAAPVDVFASASADHMDALEAAGLIDAATRVDFATNTLVLAASEGSSLEGEYSIVASKDVARIAMGNPDTSPAGKYAKQSFLSMGLWNSVSQRVVYAETVRQVIDYVSRGEVDAGVLYASDVATAKGLRTVATAPEGTYERIAYPIAVVGTSKSRIAALSFIELLMSERGRAVLHDAGLGRP